MPELISAKIAAIITRTVSIRELIHASSAPTCPAGRSSFIRSIPAGERGTRRFVISEAYLSSVRSIKPGRRATGIRVRFLRGSPRRRQACKSPTHGTGRYRREILTGHGGLGVARGVDLPACAPSVQITATRWPGCSLPRKR